MTRLDIITNLTKTGELTELYKSGLISYKILMYRDIYFDILVEEAKGNNRTQAAQNIADQYGISIDTVWRSLRYIMHKSSRNMSTSRPKTRKVLTKV